MKSRIDTVVKQSLRITKTQKEIKERFFRIAFSGTVLLFYFKRDLKVETYACLIFSSFLDLEITNRPLLEDIRLHCIVF